MKFSLTILGSSSAVPTVSRNTTAHVLNVHERFFLIDCGEGTQIQIRRFRIRFGKINHVFISHLHTDHYLGIYGLLSTMNILGRRSELHLYGPPGLRVALENHFSLMSERPDYPLAFHPLTEDVPTVILEDNEICVTSFRMKHRAPTWGFLFTEKFRQEGQLSKPLRSFAHCSDTIFDPSLVEIIKGVDLLYHEATYMHDKLAGAQARSHSTARQAGEIALMAGVGKLVVGHFSARYKEIDPLIREVRSVFQDTIEAVDGLTIELD